MEHLIQLRVRSNLSAAEILERFPRFFFINGKKATPQDEKVGPMEKVEIVSKMKIAEMI